MPASMSVFLNVTDIQRSLDFYQRLGFRLDKAYTDKESGTITYADLSMNGAELGLGNIEWNDEKEFRDWVSTPLGAGVVVYLTVPDVDRVYEKARAAKATIEFEPTDRPYGRLFMLNDPDGYSISVISEPRSRKPAARKKASGKRGGRTGAARKSAGAKKSAKKPAAKKAARKKATSTKRRR